MGCGFEVLVLSMWFAMGYDMRYAAIVACIWNTRLSDGVERMGLEIWCATYTMPDSSFRIGVVWAMRYSWFWECVMYWGRYVVLGMNFMV